MKGKKLLAMLAALMMTAASFAGCQASETESTSSGSNNSGESSESSSEEVKENMDGDVQLSEPGEFPIVIGDMVTLTAFTAPHTDSNSELDSSVNEFSKWYEDKTNIHIDWTIVTSADKVAKLNLLFTSDSYEDIIMNTSWDAATQYSYGQQGYIVPLNEYIEKDAFYYNKYIEQGMEQGSLTQEAVDTLIMPDGNIYSAGRYQGSFTSINASKMWIYQPWLDKLGLDMPTTTQEYYDVLMAFKTEDPNGNGEADEIPLTGSLKGWNTNPFEYLMNSFIYYDGVSKVYVDDGEVVMTATTDEFKTGLEYMNKLSSSGLLSIDHFTQDVNALKALAMQDTHIIGSIPGGAIISFYNVIKGEEGDWQNWTHLPPLQGPEGVQYAKYTAPNPIARIHVTNKCEYPRTAYRLIDSMYEEVIAFNGLAGMQDEFWKYSDETDIAINGEPAAFTPLMSITDSGHGKTNFCWEQIGVFTYPLGWDVKQCAYNNDPSTDPSAYIYNAYVDYIDYSPESSMVLPPLIFEGRKSDDVVDYTTAINTYITEMTASFILDGNIAESWDAYLLGLEDRGINELKELYQEAYELRTK